MPWTFSHPIAVIPIQRLFKARLNLPALVIGSLSPDFGYYGKLFSVATDAHTLRGLFLICLPSGLLVLAAFYSLRKSFCFILPDPHRTALMPLASAKPVFSIRSLGIATVSIIAGAGTHIVWDSLTHQGGWMVSHFSVLRGSLIQVGTHPLSLYYLLQQGSTFVGAAALLFLYSRWLRKQPIRREFSAGSERWRYGALFTMLILAAVVAAPFALQTAADYDGFLAIRVFLFRFAVYATMAFLPLFVLGSVFAFWRFQRRHR